MAGLGITITLTGKQLIALSYMCDHAHTRGWSQELPPDLKEAFNILKQNLGSVFATTVLKEDDGKLQH